MGMFDDGPFCDWDVLFMKVWVMWMFDEGYVLSRGILVIGRCVKGCFMTGRVMKGMFLDGDVS